jgi:hypothetical protein
MNFFFFALLLAIINGLKGAVPSSNVVSFVNLMIWYVQRGGFAASVKIIPHAVDLLQFR